MKLTEMIVFGHIDDVVQQAVEANDQIRKDAKRELIGAWTEDFLSNVNGKLHQLGLHFCRGEKGKHNLCRKLHATESKEQQFETAKQIVEVEFNKLLQHLEKEGI
jgi:hypothetical protein